MDEKLEALLESNQKKKRKARKMGNTTRVWRKDILQKATIEVKDDGEDD